MKNYCVFETTSDVMDWVDKKYSQSAVIIKVACIDR